MSSKFDTLQTDGVLALGNGANTLVDQWAATQVIDKNTYGVCLGKIPTTTQTSPMGFYLWEK